MINAADAKRIYDESGGEADALLTRIEPRIVEAAKAGKRSIFWLVDAEEAWRSNAPTPLDNHVITKLTNLGYTVRFGRDGDAYVPRGLADDDGDGPKYINYGYTIGW
jgi:hypothetical protein